MPTFGIGEVPTNISVDMRRFLTSIREAILRLESSRVPPTQVTNLRVTPTAGGNLIEFTRSDADSYTLYWNTTPSLTGAVAVPIGLAARYEDRIAAGGVTRHYWVRANKESGLTSEPIGPKSGTSLGLAVAITPPTPPVAGEIVYTSDETGEDIVGRGGAGVPETL